jgi:hypothetical protein
MVTPCGEKRVESIISNVSHQPSFTNFTRTLYLESIADIYLLRHVRSAARGSKSVMASPLANPAKSRNLSASIVR